MYYVATTIIYFLLLLSSLSTIQFTFVFAIAFDHPRNLTTNNFIPPITQPLGNNPILCNQESLSTPFGISPSIGSFGPSMVDGGEVESIGCDGGVTGQPATTE